MSAIQIIPDIYWIGVIDWNIRNFHGHTYTTRRGTTYNAYLIIDKKTALIDTVYGPFSEELLFKIEKLISPSKIDYVVINHVEVDHSGALKEILKAFPQAEVLGTKRCKEGLWRNFYLDMNFRIVKTGDTLNLGRRNLFFIEAPMIHWPDSMFTYCPEEKIIFSNDAFGQHLASSERFDDEINKEILMEEAAKYYANILWPLGEVILKKIEEIKAMNIPLEIIAPSHGIIWRKSPTLIMENYIKWAKNLTQSSIVMVYETMWKATEKMARAISQGIMDEGVSLKVYDVTNADRTEIIKDMLEAKGFLFGSSTHDNDMLPTLAGFLKFFEGLKPKKRVAAVFGSYGWSGGATKKINNLLKDIGIEIVCTPLEVHYLPNEEDIEKCYSFGKEFARIVKRGGNNV